MTQNKNVCVHSYRCNLHANLPQWDKSEQQLQLANDSLAWLTGGCAGVTGQGSGFLAAAASSAPT